MAIFIRIVMCLSWVTLVLVVGIVVILAMFGDYDPMFDVVDLPTSDVLALTAPGIAAQVFTISMLCFALYALLRLYLAIHMILKPAVQKDFARLARHVATSGWGLVSFWVAFQLLAGPATWFLTLASPAELRPSVEYFPVDLDSIFLIISLPLFSISTALRRAAEIENENNQFL